MGRIGADGRRKAESPLLPIPTQLEGYAQLGDIDTMRAQLVALLNAPAMRLHQALSANQQAFVAALSRIGKAEGEA